MFFPIGQISAIREAAGGKTSSEIEGALSYFQGFKQEISGIPTAETTCREGEQGAFPTLI
jgi:hypothetical protein